MALCAGGKGLKHPVQHRPPRVVGLAFGGQPPPGFAVEEGAFALNGNNAVSRDLAALDLAAGTAARRALA